MADQAVVSLGNYVTGLVVLQTLPREEFGAFFLLSGLLLLLNTVQWSLVSYPLSVRGATAADEELRRLVGISMAKTFVLAVPLGAILAAVTVSLQRPMLVPCVLAAMLLWQAQETVRRGHMARLRHRAVLPGDAIAFGGRAAAVAILAKLGVLSLELAFAAIAVASFIALVVQSLQVRPLMPKGSAVLSALAGDWAFGRWMLLTSGTAIGTMQFVPWALGWFESLQAVAVFGAMALVMALPNPVVIAIGGLLVPAVASAAPQGMRAVRRATFTLALPGAALLLPYFAIVLISPDWVYAVLTKQAATGELAANLRLYALGYALTLPGQVMQSILAGLGRPRLGFAAQSAHFAATLLLVVPATAIFGLAGAVWAGLLPGVALSCIAAVMLRRVAAEFSSGPAVSPSDEHPVSPAGGPARSRA
jgi:O-antigen/teichoic acid export membrane protein